MIEARKRRIRSPSARARFRPTRKIMRQYLPLVWILGVAAACSGTDDGQDVSSGGTSPTAGSATSSGGGPGVAGTQASSGGSASGGTSVAPTAGATPGGIGGSGSGGSASPQGGKASTGGSGGSSAAGSTNGGAAGTGGTGTKTIPDFEFPTSVGADQKLSSTKEVTTFDGKMARYIGTGDLGGSGQGEGQDPLFLVKAGGTLKNVILGAPAADGVHCEGSCTIENVWWEDVGEDAITLLGKSTSNVYRITGGGARKATDKVIQHNGAGTLFVKNFLVEDFGKLYRSCGNCGDQYQRKSEFDTIVANGSKSILAGVNQNYKDSAKFTNIFADITMKICERFQGNDSGAEPTSLGSGADGTSCIYQASDITWH